MMLGGRTEYYNRSRVNVFILLIYLILGAYFINYPFNFMKVPESVLQFNNWIILVGGIFMLFGAIHYFQAKRFS